MRTRLLHPVFRLLLIIATCLFGSVAAQQIGGSKDYGESPPLVTPRTGDLPAKQQLEDPDTGRVSKGPAQTGAKRPAAKEPGPPSSVAKCGPRARSTWKRVAGWGAIAVGATNCGFSWGFRDKAQAEWRAMDECSKKTTGCRVVEYNQ